MSKTLEMTEKMFITIIITVGVVVFTFIVFLAFLSEQTHEIEMQHAGSGLVKVNNGKAWEWQKPKGGDCECSK